MSQINETPNSPTIEFLQQRNLIVEERPHGYVVKNMRGTDNIRTISRLEVEAIEKLGKISLLAYDGSDVLAVYVDAKRD